VRRVLIIGSSGAGKSTLGRALADRLGLPLVSLDRLHWRPGWREPEAAEWRRLVAEATAGERWIIEGNYTGTIPERLRRADTVLWLDYPRHVCIRRVLQRVARWHGRVRPDMAPG
jgi:adenylate kinase family enzyme